METLASIIESILFVSGNEVAVKDISDKLGIPEKDILSEAKKLQEKKYGDGSGVKLLIFNKKLQLCSNKDNADSVATVLNPIRERELSRSMLEVAAIIAYKQPVTRTDLEEIRMCSCEYAIQNLLKLGVIDVVGRKEALGRPVLFGTTDDFLKRFQISSLDELPDYDEMLNKIKQMNGGDSNYLYKKDVYDEKNDPEHTDAEKKSSETDGENGDLVDAEAKPVENADENVEPVNTEEENISEPSAGDDEGVDEESVDEESVDEESVDEESEKSSVPDFLGDDESETA